MTATHDGRPVSAAVDHIESAQLATAGNGRGKWAGRLATVTAAYHLARQAQTMWTTYRTNRSYIVVVAEGDDIYDQLQRLVLDRLPDTEQRAVMARTRSSRGDVSPADGDRRIDRVVRLHFDGARVQTLTIEGHDVQVVVERDDSTKIAENGGFRTRPSRVVFTCPDMSARAAVVRFLQEVADSLQDKARPPRLMIATPWHEWRVVRDLGERNLDSVFLPLGHLDGIMADLERFLASEAQYLRLGVPWHRGYLFHGPPGTGKSTTAAAIGTHLRMDVHALSLTDVRSNSGLAELIGGINRGLLLIEDIDVVKAAKDRDETAVDPEKPGVTLDGLLNALDGLITPHGLVTVMTTNKRDVLDGALHRAGRVDLDLEMTYLTPRTFGAVVRYFTGRPFTPASALGAGGWPAITPADIVGVCVEHMYDPDAAVVACAELLADRLSGMARNGGVPGPRDRTPVAR